MSKKLFDICCGNPPYQAPIKNKGDRPNPVYDKFMDAAYEVADCVELIHPARFLFNAGQTAKSWNEKMLNDPHFKVLHYESNATNIFPNTDIKGGVAITIRDGRKDFGIIGTFTKYAELNDIIKAVFGARKLKCLDSIISARGTYRLTDAFFNDFPYAQDRLGKGTGNMIASNFFERMPEVWREAGRKEDIGILARIKNQRKYCYIDRKYVRMNPFIDKFNVVSPKSNGNGIFGEVLTATEIVSAGAGATDTFINIGAFDTKEEAEALTSYIKTKFLRAMLGIKKVTQDNSRGMWDMIPLQDFTASSDIDWSRSIHEIDLQLYRKYKLSKEEIDFIENNVKEMV